MYDILELKKKKLQDLQDIAEKLKISDLKNYKKLDLIYEILLLSSRVWCHFSEFDSGLGTRPRSIVEYAPPVDLPDGSGGPDAPTDKLAVPQFSPLLKAPRKTI